MFRRIALAVALLCVPGIATAQASYGSRTLATVGYLSADGKTTIPASASNPLPTTCISGCSGGSGGSVTQGTSPWVSQETPSTSVSTSALAANLVVTSSASKRLASFQVSADSTLSSAAWWVMIYNATSAPADGAVTPVKCYAVPSGATSLGASFPDSSPSFSTGITIGVSTTGCFTKSASTHAFISGDIE